MFIQRKFLCVKKIQTIVNAAFKIDPGFNGQEFLEPQFFSTLKCVYSLWVVFSVTSCWSKCSACNRTHLMTFSRHFFPTTVSNVRDAPNPNPNFESKLNIIDYALWTSTDPSWDFLGCRLLRSSSTLDSDVRAI